MQCSIVPSSEDCTLAAASINQMDSVYQSAPAEIQARFQSAHDSIMGTYNSNYSWYSSYIPFNTACEALCNLATQAEQLMGQIQSAMGQSPTPGSGLGPGLNLQSLLGSASNLIIIGGIIFAIIYFSPKK